MTIPGGTEAESSKGARTENWVEGGERVTRQWRASIGLIVVSLAGYAQHAPGTVSAWGWDGFGELGDGTTTYYNGTPAPVTGLTGVMAVAAGSFRSMALKHDGTVWTWGGNPNLELGNGASYTYSTAPVQVSSLTGVTAIASGSLHGLALKSDGTVWTWGNNGSGQLGIGTTGNSIGTPVQVIGLANVVAIAGGASHSLAMKSDGTIWAWGDNSAGELGNGNTTNSSTPVQVAGFSGAVAIAAGGNLSVAVKSGGTVWAWGNNGSGQLGNGTTTNSSTPVQASGLTGETAVGAGNNYSLGLKSDGTVWAWGSNSFEGLNLGIASVTPVQVTGFTGETAIAAGSNHSLALKSDGTVWALGFNNYGQLGNGNVLNAATPLQVNGLTGMTAIAAGGSHSLAVKNDGTVWAWGWNGYGQLGNGTAPFSTAPVQTIDLTGVVGIAGGNEHSLAVKSDGTVWTWGINTVGELGNGTTNNSSTPVQVSGLTNVTGVAGGVSNSLAVKSDGTVWAWGNNGSGELGNGTTTNSSTPVQVSGLSGMVAVSAGQFYGLALKSDGTVWAWGNNGNGQLGNGSFTNRSSPFQVSGLTGVTAIAAGFFHGLALKSDGTVWAWGDNNFGELGNGQSLTNSSTPVQVSGLTNVASVAAGEYHSLAVKNDGTVWTWGNNGFGQLGNGTAGTTGSFTISSTPVQVLGLTGAVAASGGEEHSMALKSDGTVWAWGNNSSGQLGNGTYTSSDVPIQVSSLAGVLAVAAGGYSGLASLPQPAPVLSIAKSHTGSFAQGQQGATYTVTVANGAGAGSTSGTVTVMETLPAGLTLVSITGSAWNCVSNTCSRSDVLNPGISYPAITVTVNVASNAPSQVTNQVTVSGGGSVTAAANDPTNITAASTVTNVTSSTANGTYGAGSSISIQMTFSGAVTVTGTPQLALNSGGTASYSSGSGTATLTFTYTVGASDSSAHLDYSSAAALTLNGGTINATLTLPAPGAAGSLGANKSIVIGMAAPATFFTGEVSLGSGVYYLQFPNGNVFGYYNYPSFPIVYHYDLGFEAFVDGGNGAAYLYDFASSHWFYTSTTLFPYLYDFTLSNWLYYFPAPNNPGHYSSNPRYFSDLTTGKIITE
jgi:alpha-tubulin suppressor-like RCC1 family protein